MTQAERKRLLHDKWPDAPRVGKQAMISALEEASKARVFEHKDDPCEHNDK